ncbi:MAG TPA: cation diffusion facilitator family transporter [Actinomycetota bacterium]|nr:cation diffusion facilitator family transporter [Actinomycetota bacterium]
MKSSPTRGAERAARAALFITAALAVAKIAVWLATSSLAVLSQAVDSLLDVVALGLVLFAVRIAARPADTSHNYGHAKAENLAAFAQTIFLGLIVIGIGLEAVRRLATEGPAVDTPVYAFALLAVSAVVDAGRAVVLIRAARSERSEALRAGALNIATDVGTALVVIVSLGLTGAGVESADAFGSVIVALAVAVAAYRLGRRSVDVLMDTAPAARLAAIEEAAGRATGVAETRRVRVRGTSDQLFADVTVAAGRTASLERAHDIAEAVEAEIRAVAPGTDVVVHVEPVSETSGFVERAQAAASRVDGVREVHNVLVHAFEEGGRRRLHVTLHGKVANDTSLSEAHVLSDAVEAAVAAELGEAVRVDSHLEPLKRTTVGRDVTDVQTELVTAVEDAAQEEEDVLDCHEVLVTSSPEGLVVVAHVRGRGDLPLARLHDASERIEKRIHERRSEVASVVIHFEPADA